MKFQPDVFHMLGLASHVGPMLKDRRRVIRDFRKNAAIFSRNPATRALGRDHMDKETFGFLLGAFASALNDDRPKSDENKDDEDSESDLGFYSWDWNCHDSGLNSVSWEPPRHHPEPLMSLREGKEGSCLTTRLWEILDSTRSGFIPVDFYVSTILTLCNGSVLDRLYMAFFLANPRSAYNSNLLAFFFRNFLAYHPQFAGILNANVSETGFSVPTVVTEGSRVRRPTHKRKVASGKLCGSVMNGANIDYRFRIFRMMMVKGTLDDIESVRRKHKKVYGIDIGPTYRKLVDLWRSKADLLTLRGFIDYVLTVSMARHRLSPRLESWPFTEQYRLRIDAARIFYAVHWDNKSVIDGMTFANFSWALCNVRLFSSILGVRDDDIEALKKGMAKVTDGQMPVRGQCFVCFRAYRDLPRWFNSEPLRQRVPQDEYRLFAEVDMDFPRTTDSPTLSDGVSESELAAVLHRRPSYEGFTLIPTAYADMNLDFFVDREEHMFPQGDMEKELTGRKKRLERRLGNFTEGVPESYASVVAEDLIARHAEIYPEATSIFLDTLDEIVPLLIKDAERLRPALFYLVEEFFRRSYKRYMFRHLHKHLFDQDSWEALHCPLPSCESVLQSDSVTHKAELTAMNSSEVTWFLLSKLFFKLLDGNVDADAPRPPRSDDIHSILSEYIKISFLNNIQRERQAETRGERWELGELVHVGNPLSESCSSEDVNATTAEGWWTLVSAFNCRRCSRPANGRNGTLKGSLVTKRSKMSKEGRISTNAPMFFGDRNFRSIFAICMSVHQSVTRLAMLPIGAALTPAEFRVADKFMIYNGHPTTLLFKSEFAEFCDWAPRVFRDVRRMSGISDLRFSNIFAPDCFITGLILGGLHTMVESVSFGKSGSLFYYPPGGIVILKTMCKREHVILRRCLASYHRHLSRFPTPRPSLLAKYLGCHAIQNATLSHAQDIGEPPKHHPMRIRLRGERIVKRQVSVRYFCIMQNVSWGAAKVVARYDLKGGARRSKAFRGDQATRLYNTYKSPLPDTILTEEDLCLRTRRNFLLGISIGAEAKTQLMDQLRLDVEFLTRLQFLDYSLLVAVASVDSGRSVINGNAYLSICGDYIFYFGLIDILTLWDYRKKTEYALRGLGGRRNISAQNPRRYGQRLLEFVEAWIT